MYKNVRTTLNDLLRLTVHSSKWIYMFILNKKTYARHRLADYPPIIFSVLLVLHDTIYRFLPEI